MYQTRYKPFGSGACECNSVLCKIKYEIFHFQKCWVTKPQRHDNMEREAKWDRKLTSECFLFPLYSVDIVVVLFSPFMFYDICFSFDSSMWILSSANLNQVCIYVDVCRDFLGCQTNHCSKHVRWISYRKSIILDSCLLCRQTDEQTKT